jgi:glycosyltransferase involved in cell wall biosynthesis
MNIATISVVTPSFNQGKFMRETIRPVLDQDYPALEYVVVDGDSTDGSVEIIKEYSHRLKYRVSEPDRGHGPALNKSFAKTTGEIMSWLNSR